MNTKLLLLKEAHDYFGNKDVELGMLIPLNVAINTIEKIDKKLKTTLAILFDTNAAQKYYKILITELDKELE